VKALLLAALAAVLALAQWVASFNPTPGPDYALAACLFGNYVAVVGYSDLPRQSPVVVLLDRESGSAAGWLRGESGYFAACASTGDVFYATGRGAVGAEVLPGRYTVKATAPGKEYAQTVEVKPSQNQTLTMQVPTAVLNIVVLDDDRRSIDRYVTAVVITGPVAVELSTPPRGLEVPPGKYTIRVTALGRESLPVTVEVGPGEEKTVEVIVLGTAGYDQLPARPTLVVVTYAVVFWALITAFILLWQDARRGQVSPSIDDPQPPSGPAAVA